MSKDFSFPFYVNNWIGGVMYYNFEQKGAYLELLLLQFNHGKFTETQVKQVLNISYSNVWSVIKEKFQTDGTYFWNERMEIVKEERRLYTESRRNNRLGKTSKTSVEHKKNTRKTYVKRMEGEGEGEDISNGETGVQGVKEKEFFEGFRVLYQGTKRGLETEFGNFQKKHKDWDEVLPLLKPAVEKQIQVRLLKKQNNEFTPEWKNLQTWINQRCWEEQQNGTTKPQETEMERRQRLKREDLGLA